MQSDAAKLRRDDEHDREAGDAQAVVREAIWQGRAVHAEHW